MKRTGLQRLACPASCDVGPLYSTVASLETRVRPVCGECGCRMVPESLELAAAVLSPEEFEQHPAFGDYCRQRSSIQHGQQSHIQRGRKVRGETALAAERVEADRRRDARARQLAGLVQYRAAGLAADEIPF